MSIRSDLVAALVFPLACGNERAADDLFAEGERAGSGDAPGLEAGRASFGGHGTSGALGSGLGGAGSAQGGLAGAGVSSGSGGSAQDGSSGDAGVSGSSAGGAEVAGASGVSGAGAGGAIRGGASGAAGASPSGGNAASGAAGSANGSSAGVAGSAGTGGKSSLAECAQLRSKTDTLLEEAQACEPDESRSCAGLLTDECGCHVAVNDPDSPEAQSYIQAVARLNERCTVTCWAVLCREPADAGCLWGLPASRCVARGFTGVRPDL